MRHGSLFSGIGGFDLASRWMGWENVFHCEINPFCQKVLSYHFPESIQHHDITKTDFSIYRGRIDILTGGFPCQPFSVAGKQLGTEDDRHLWPEMLRAIREIQPSWIVGENVHGLVNWSRGLVFEQVQVDLEDEGYEVIPFILPACAVNAPHRRDRVWFVAYSLCSGYGGRTEKRRSDQPKEWQVYKDFRQHGDGVRSETKRCSKVITYSNIIGLEGGVFKDWRKYKISTFNASTFYPFSLRYKWKNFPTQPAICSGDDGLSDRLDGITFSSWRKESIKAYGNAVVPELVLEIFKAIDKHG